MEFTGPTVADWLGWVSLLFVYIVGILMLKYGKSATKETELPRKYLLIRNLKWWAISMVLICLTLKLIIEIAK